MALREVYPVRKCDNCGSSTPVQIEACHWCAKGGATPRAPTDREQRAGQLDARRFS